MTILCQTCIRQGVILEQRREKGERGRGEKERGEREGGGRREEGMGENEKGEVEGKENCIARQRRK